VNTKINQRRARALTFMLSLGMLAGVLIWAKLRLVTDIPRSALAVPKEVDGVEESSGDFIIEQGSDESGDSGDFERPSDEVGGLPGVIED